MEKFITLLANIDLFKCFSANELDTLFTNDYYKIQEYAKNSVIYFQNEKCESMDVILNGTVLVQKIDSAGDLLTICNFSNGDIFGGNLLFSHKNVYPMTILAKSNSTIIHVKKDLIFKLCQNNIIFLNNFLQSISDKTLILTDKIKSLTLKTIRQCIIEFLLYEHYIQQNTTIRLDMSKKELSEKIGVQRPSLSRELNKMRKDGLISYDSKFINIKNIDLIKKLHVDT